MEGDPGMGAPPPVTPRDHEAVLGAWELRARRGDASGPRRSWWPGCPRTCSSFRGSQPCSDARPGQVRGQQGKLRALPVRPISEPKLGSPGLCSPYSADLCPTHHSAPLLGLCPFLQPNRDLGGSRPSSGTPVPTRPRPHPHPQRRCAAPAAPCPRHSRAASGWPPPAAGPGPGAAPSGPPHCRPGARPCSDPGSPGTGRAQSAPRRAPPPQAPPSTGPLGSGREADSGPEPGPAGPTRAPVPALTYPDQETPAQPSSLPLSSVSCV